MELKYVGGFGSSSDTTGGFDGAQVYRRAQVYMIELKYTGGFDGSSSIREGLIELKYTGGFDRAQVYMRVG